MNTSGRKDLHSLRLLSSYWFISGLLILLLNDLFFKQAFHNGLTGKLSDFAGLFVFALFWMALFPKHVWKITPAIGLLFILWKSPYSQWLIDGWNRSGLFSIGRVVDYTDLVALSVLPFAYRISRKEQPALRLSPVIPLFISMFAFAATSNVKSLRIGKSYSFDMSLNALVTHINHISTDTLVRDLPLSLNSANSNYKEFNGRDTSYYFVSGYREYRDTFYISGSKEIDSIRVYRHPIKDTLYVIPGREFTYTVSIGKFFKRKKKKFCDAVSVKMVLGGDETYSSLWLTSIEGRNCFGMFEKGPDDKDIQKAFEEEFIEKLK